MKRTLLECLVIALILATIYFLHGCATTQPEPLRLGNSKRLQGRADFPVAGKAAPEWVLDALASLDELEQYIVDKEQGLR